MPLYDFLILVLLAAIPAVLLFRRRVRQLRGHIVEFLGRRSPDYGIGIQLGIQHLYGAAYSPTLLYPTLRALEREGILRSEDRNEGSEGRGGRPRRYYYLVEQTGE